MSPYLSNNSKGFSLLELMVSITIMLVIISTVLLGQSTYTKGASLKNLANDIGLSLRQAQVYGISVKERAIGSDDFLNAYGIEFNITSSGSNNAYIFFADLSKNGAYDGAWSCPAGGECLQKFNTSTGNTISRLCLIYNNDSTDCSVSRASISFLRPNTLANIVLFGPAGQIPPSASHKGVEIGLVSVSGGARSVIVYNTGQISIK